VDQQQGLPTNFVLFQNYPNPFNPNTKIAYQIPTSSHVTLGFFDLLGREVAMLVDREEASGRHDVSLKCIRFIKWHLLLQATSRNLFANNKTHGVEMRKVHHGS